MHRWWLVCVVFFSTLICSLVDGEGSTDLHCRHHDQCHGHGFCNQRSGRCVCAPMPWVDASAEAAAAVPSKITSSSSSSSFLRNKTDQIGILGVRRDLTRPSRDVRSGSWGGRWCNESLDTSNDDDDDDNDLLLSNEPCSLLSDLSACSSLNGQLYVRSIPDALQMDQQLAATVDLLGGQDSPSGDQSKKTRSKTQLLLAFGKRPPPPASGGLRSRPRLAFYFALHDQRTNRHSAAAAPDNSTGLGQVCLMLDVLWSKRHLYVFGVDQATSPGYVAALKRYIGGQWGRIHQPLPDNVVFVTPSRRVVWSGRSVAETMLDGMRHALAATGTVDWDLWINLSGSDFPLHSLTTLEDQLARHLGWTTVHGAYVHSYEALGSVAKFTELMDQFASNTVECCGTAQLLWAAKPRKRTLRRFWPAHGHLWLFASRLFVHSLVADPHLWRWLHQALAFARVPDEKLFLTYLLNSVWLRHTWRRSATRFERWTHGANHPVTLTDSNFDQIYGRHRRRHQHHTSIDPSNTNSSLGKNAISTEHLFARKLSFSKSKHLMARIVQWLDLHIYL